MLDRLILVAALITTTLPPPQAAVSPSPNPGAAPALKTIANVRASARCADIITHANGAIDKELDNDRVIGQTITALRTTDLDDGNQIHRRNGLNNLGSLAKTLMMQARSGDDEVKRLRKIAAQTKDPAEAKALKDFADELGGALWRQQTIARDLNGYLAYVDFTDMATFDESQQQANLGVFGVRDPLAQMPTVNPGVQARVGSGPNAGDPAPMLHPHLGHEYDRPTATEYEQYAANDFQNRIPGILVDESHAESKVDGALQGC